MGVHSPTELVAAWVTLGKASFENAQIGAAIGLAESGGRDDAKHVNPGGRGTDRGVMQINSVAHPDVSDKCAYDFVCNITKAGEISHGGTNWAAWKTYSNGRYKGYLGRVQREATKDKVGKAAKDIFVNQINPNDPFGDPLKAVTGAVDGVVGGVKDAANATADFFNWITDPSSWLRIGKGTLGLTFIVAGTATMVFVVGNKAKGTAIGQGVASATRAVKS